MPGVYAVDAASGTIALEWIEGHAMGGELPRAGAAMAARLGRTLAAVHGAGVALCDGHPGNALYSHGRVVIIDLEFAALAADATPARLGFDLAYASAFMPDEPCRRALLAGYGVRANDLELAFAVAARSLLAFAPLVRLEARRWKPATLGALS